MTVVLGVANALIVAAGTLAAVWRSTDGRRAFRNPWVGGAVIAGLVCAIGCLIGAFVVRGRNSELSGVLAVTAFVVFLIGCGAAKLEAERRREEVRRLISLDGAEIPEEAPFVPAADQMFAAMGPDRMLALRQLISRTGGAPGYDWLTVDWVDAQMARHSRSAMPTQDRIGSAESSVTARHQ